MSVYDDIRCRVTATKDCEDIQMEKCEKGIVQTAGVGVRCLASIEPFLVKEGGSGKSSRCK